MTTLETMDLVMAQLMGRDPEGKKNSHFTMEKWEWPQGVAMYSMYKVYKSTGDKAWLKKMEDWFDWHFAKGLPDKNINTAAPLTTLCFLYEETKNEKYLKPIIEWSDWVMKGLPRTEEGGFRHITSDSANEQQLWDDTLFMTVLFLYRAGIVLGRKDYTDEAKYQFLLHIKYLHEPKNGLWYHGFCFIGRHHFGEAFWARGNSWFTAGAIDFIEWLDEKDAVRRLIENTWVEQCKALCNLQDEKTGLWHTLLDHEDSYLETSASAAIAYGLKKGVRLGLLDEKCGQCAEKAVQGVLSQIEPDGVVQGVSYGTPMGHDLDFYRQIPVCPTAYGQGLTFLMLTEEL